MNERLPQNRQFSQADPRVQQRPEGLDALDAKGVIASDVPNQLIERYAEMQATPGRWDEHFGLTTLPMVVEYGRGILIEKDLGFIANSFCVDNWTNQWLYEPNLKRFIPPYSGGWIFPIPNGYQKGRVELRSPAAFTLPAALVNEFAWLGWHEATLPPATGVSLAPGTTGAGGTVIAGPLASATTLATLSATGAVQTATPGEWSITAQPAVNVAASVTRAAVGGTRHVARTIAADVVAGTTAPAGIVLNPVLRDGATGVGAILWGRYLALEAVIGFSDDTASGGTMNVVGTAGNAMTLEFTAAGGANTFESVALTGYDAT